MADPISTVTEEFHVVDGVPLRLAFSPAAVREHLDLGEEVSDATLLRVGFHALGDDDLYGAFDSALRAAFALVTGIPPEAADADGPTL